MPKNLITSSLVIIMLISTGQLAHAEERQYSSLVKRVFTELFSEVRANGNYEKDVFVRKLIASSVPKEEITVVSVGQNNAIYMKNRRNFMEPCKSKDWEAWDSSFAFIVHDGIVYDLGFGCEPTFLPIETYLQNVFARETLENEMITIGFSNYSLHSSLRPPWISGWNKYYAKFYLKDFVDNPKIPVFKLELEEPVVEHRYTGGALPYSYHLKNAWPLETPDGIYKKKIFFFNAEVHDNWFIAKTRDGFLYVPFSVNSSLYKTRVAPDSTNISDFFAGDSDGKLLVISGWKNVDVYSVDKKAKLYTVDYHETCITTDSKPLAFLKDNKIVSFGPYNRKIFIHNTDNNQIEFILSGFQDKKHFNTDDNYGTALAVNKDSSFLAVGSTYGRFQLWSLDSHAIVFETIDHYKWRRIVKIIFSPDGKRVAVTHSRNITKIWNLKTESLQTVLPGGLIGWIDNDFVAVDNYTARDSNIEIWNVENGKDVSFAKDFWSDNLGCSDVFLDNNGMNMIIKRNERLEHWSKDPNLEYNQCKKTR